MRGTRVAGAPNDWQTHTARQALQKRGGQAQKARWTGRRYECQDKAAV
jgi:hypothetical protein